MYSIFDAAEIIGRSTYCINDWASQHNIGKENVGTTHCMLYTIDEAKKIAKVLGHELSDEIPVAKSNRAVLRSKEGMLTPWQVRKMAGNNCLPIVQTGDELGLGRRGEIEEIQYEFTKKDLREICKKVGLPDPFKEKNDELSTPPLPVPAGFFTIIQASELLGIPTGRTTALASRSNVLQRDHTHPKRFMLSKDAVRQMAQDEGMPDPFTYDLKAPLDTTGEPWTRFEHESRRMIVALAYDARMTTDEGDIFFSWWVWEITQEEKCIVHGREYKSRDDAIKVAAKAFDMSVNKLLKVAQTTDRLDHLRAAIWASGESQNEIAARIGTSARLLWRFVRGWNVRKKLEDTIAEAFSEVA
jgi:hypothetical protein